MSPWQPQSPPEPALVENQDGAGCKATVELGARALAGSRMPGSIGEAEPGKPSLLGRVRAALMMSRTDAVGRERDGISLLSSEGSVPSE